MDATTPEDKARQALVTLHADRYIRRRFARELLAINTVLNPPAKPPGPEQARPARVGPASLAVAIGLAALAAPRRPL